MRAAVLASANPHKLAELRAALPGWGIDLLGAAGYPPEDGASYYENALGKARFGRGLAPAGAWVLGEDSVAEDLSPRSLRAKQGYRELEADKLEALVAYLASLTE